MSLKSVWHHSRKSIQRLYSGWKHATAEHHNKWTLGRVRMAAREKIRTAKRLEARSRRNESKRLLAQERADAGF